MPRRLGSLAYAQIVFAACAYAQCSVDFDWASVRHISFEMIAAHDYYQLTPSTTLNWTPCYSEPLECTRLEVRPLALKLIISHLSTYTQVPLDYSNPNGSTAAIALIRIPSALPANSTDYRGPILVNPGGPGNRYAALLD